MKLFDLIADFFKPKEPEYKKILKTYEIKDSEEKIKAVKTDKWLEDYKKNGIKHWNLEFLMSLEWKRYEEICKEFLTIKENRKYKVELTKIGADGGIDLTLHNENGELVGIGQCKAYNSKISVDKIRELYGVMASENAEKGYFFTTSSFTNDCIEFAKNKKIELITGNQQIDIIKSFPKHEQDYLYKLAKEGDYTTPTCPNCNKKMVKRVGKEKGNEFWGCSNYPRCRNILQIRKK